MPGGGEDQRKESPVALRVEQGLQNRKCKGSCLAAARLRDANDIAA
jgi:hypothetical protein